MSKPSILDISEFLPYQLVSLSTKVSDDFAQVYSAEAGLTQAQWRVLSHLFNLEFATAKRVCELANMDKSTVSRAIKQLEEKQLLRLSKHPTDKRASVLEATEAGLTLYTQLTPKAKEWERTLLSNFSDDETATFRELVAKLYKSVEEKGEH
ncbi:MarR family winged helix-turn-helix transcriptional regulator [Pseudoalteromonas sp. SMS1]|uniref:MarR family winged helix-turn-helix transcriptional regulator n=1 Tax=Pseudoalteromonas sp. SMS1 TaxID=2908894 RepID=UPI001F30F616|nr:MarR family winged helix-turn-helix transcriptional regulator [Pseudoalteromonas sp. SMS1]MCF2856075.1 MarR family winged helix-turn-helix transcriptional regulator [Pseudoalteromonas sp. SMS1]